MATALQTLVEEHGLENTRIQVGRERLWPPREGLATSASGIEQLEQALRNPAALKGTVKITDRENTNTLLWVSKGAVKVPLDTTQQNQTIEPVSDFKAQSLEPQKEVIREVVDEMSLSDLFAAEVQAQLPLEGMGAASETDASTISSSPGVPEVVSDLPTTQPENEAARETYTQLLQEHPDYKSLGVTSSEELAELPVEVQKRLDGMVADVALIKELPGEDLARILGQGSPHIQSQLAQGTLAEVGRHLTEMSSDYWKRLDEKLFPASEQASAPQINVFGAPVTEPKTRQSEQLHTREFDFPTDATNHVAPLPELVHTAQETAASVKDNLEMAQRNLVTFAKTVKHRGLKAWAKEQLPVLRDKALQVAQDQGSKVRDWAQEKAAPAVKGAVVNAAQTVGREVAITAEIAGEIGKAYASVAADAVVRKGTELGTQARDKANEITTQARGKAQEVGTKLRQKYEDFTSLIDPQKADLAIEELIKTFGNDGAFQGRELNYQKNEQGVSVHLKDGTPVYVNGKFNNQVDGRFAEQINRISENLQHIKSEVLAPSVQMQQASHAKGFGR